MSQVSSDRSRMWLEEWLNTISHGIGAVAATVGFIFLIVYGAYSNNDWALLSAAFFGLSLMSVYFSSTAYHAVTNLELKRLLQKVDHACIFLLIAGTYTPLLLITIGGTYGWVFFSVIWAVAVVGVYLKLFHKEAFDSFSLWTYSAMGWVAVFEAPHLYEVMPAPGFWLIVAGGLSYTFGIIFFVLDSRVPFSHFIWHLFVILGSTLHYLAILLYVV